MTDAVERLTPLGLMVLALLDEDDMHAYEMLRLMRARNHSRIVALTQGTLYHTVARLERHGMIAELGVDRAGNRPERTVYRLSDAGAVALREWVRRELPRADRPDRFAVALAEAHNLPRDDVIALLGQRRDAVARRLAEHLERREQVLAAGVLPQFLLHAEREDALAAADLDWLDAAIDRIRRPDLVWGVADIPPTDRYLAQREAARS